MGRGDGGAAPALAARIDAADHHAMMGPRSSAEPGAETTTALPEHNLDILRAVAVACVVADHFAWPFTAGALWAVGVFGVFLFFVHTSLVLMASLERMAARAGSPARLASAFYARRAFRIYPLAWAAITLTLVLRIPASVEHLPPGASPFLAPNAAGLLANLTLTQNMPGWAHRSVLGVLWSLPVELQMYVLLPVLWWIARRRLGAWWLAGVLLPLSMRVALAYRSGAFEHVPGLQFLPNVVYYAPCFVPGVLAYAIIRSRQQAHRTAPWPAWTWALVLLVAAASYAIGHPAPAGSMEWRGWLGCVALGALIPFVRDLEESPLTRTAHHVAKYSYGIYLLHIPAQWAGMVALASWPWEVRWGASAMLLVALPVLSYHAIEEPGIRAGQRITSGGASPAALAPAP